jgi:hypothetical protein
MLDRFCQGAHRSNKGYIVDLRLMAINIFWEKREKKSVKD